MTWIFHSLSQELIEWLQCWNRASHDQEKRKGQNEGTQDTGRGRGVRVAVGGVQGRACWGGSQLWWARAALRCGSSSLSASIPAEPQVVSTGQSRATRTLPADSLPRSEQQHLGGSQVIPHLLR